MLEFAKAKGMSVGLVATSAIADDTGRPYNRGDCLVPEPVEAILAQLSINPRLCLGVGWTTSGHTATPLFTFGVGPSAERLRGFQHNTELFAVMRDALAP